MMQAYSRGQIAEEKAHGDIDAAADELIAAKNKLHEIWTRAALPPHQQDELATLLNQIPTTTDFTELTK